MANATSDLAIYHSITFFLPVGHHKKKNNCTHLDVGPVDLLPLVLSLLHLEHVLVEVLLQLLVGEVDAELKTWNVKFGSSSHQRTQIEYASVVCNIDERLSFFCFASGASDSLLHLHLSLVHRPCYQDAAKMASSGFKH